MHSDDDPDLKMDDQVVQKMISSSRLEKRDDTMEVSPDWRHHEIDGLGKPVKGSRTSRSKSTSQENKNYEKKFRSDFNINPLQKFSLNYKDSAENSKGRKPPR